jgi:hypothetical protein
MNTTADELHRAQLEREGTAIIEAATTAEVKARTAKRQRLDALDRKYHFELNGGNETTLDDIADTMSDEPSVFGTSAQERNFERKERAAQNERRAKLEGMGLSEHTAANLHAEVKALELTIKHPTSDKALKSDVAKLESILKRLDVAKIFETRIAPLLGVSKRSAERLAAEGRTLWADLIKLATARLVDPDKALPYLSTLPRLLQLEVAHAAERCREEWAIETEIERWARKPKLDHGTLDALPDAQLCRLREQCRDMLNLTPASFVFVYANSGVTALSASAVESSEQRKIHELEQWPNSARVFFLDFLKCWVGDPRLAATNRESLAVLRALSDARNAVLFRAVEAGVSSDG